MLEQERKIRAKQAAGGVVFKGYVTEQPISEPVPFHTSTIGEKMGKGGYTVKRSSARKGKTHVVIGPDGTKKYFGDSKLGQHPKDPARKKSFYARHAKNLKGNPYFRAFARATWADGGKLGQGIYDMGLMPYGMGGHTQEGPMSQLYAPHTGESVDIRYADGGYIFAPKMDYDGRINVPYGYNTPAYNERYDFGGTIGAAGTGIIGGVLGTVPFVGGALKQGAYKLGESFQGPLSDQEKSIRGYGSAVGGAATGIATANPGAISQVGSGLAEGISATNKNATSQGIASGLNFAGGIGGAFMGQQTPFNTMTAMHGGYVHMADGGQTGLVPINVEGANFSQGSGPDAKKGELLVINGKIIKNYVGRPPHPTEGQNSMGDDEAPEGLIVIPKARTAEYLEAGLMKRKQIEKSLVSQQQDREMKKSKKMGDGGYYSFGMGEMGMRDGGPIGNPEIINDITYGTMKKGGWIQKATASIKRRGTEGVCTGSKFGSSSCPPGSRRYNLAKTFRKMARSRHEDGGFVDPVTGSYTVMYGEGSEVKGNASRWNAWNNPYTVVAVPDLNSSFPGDSIRVFPGQRYPQGMPYMRDLGNAFGVTSTDYSIMSHPNARVYQDSTYMQANPERLPKRTKQRDGGQLPESLLRTRMKASGASPEEINRYVAAKYEMGGPTNVDRSAIYAGMRSRFNYGGRAMMQTGSVVSPEQTSTAGVYGPLAGYSDYGSYSYYDPSAENYDPSMSGWYGYKDGVPTSITDPNYTRLLNESYMPSNLGSSYGQGNSNANSSARLTGPNLGGAGPFSANAVATRTGPPTYEEWASQYSTGPGSYVQNPTYKASLYQDNYMKSTPDYGTTSTSSSNYLDPDVRRAMRAYGIAGGIYGGAQIAEGLLSKPETYKRMPLRREKPELLNPREALADVTRTMAGYKYAGRQTGPNQRNFLTSLASKDAAARAGIYGQYDNANAQIRNAYKDALVRDQMALMQQDQYAQMFDAQARAARRNMIRSGLGDLAGTAGNYANMAIQNKYLGKMGSAGNLD
jgi:hypothetical protein